MKSSPSFERLVLSLVPAVVAVTSALAWSACGSSDVVCRVDSECNGGEVCSVGRCVPLAEAPDLSVGNDVDLAPRSGDMAQPPAPDGFSPDALTSGCPFNNDGIIQRAEIPAMPGLGGFFVSNQSGTTATVNLNKVGGIWDFSAVSSGEEKVFDGLTSPTGTWWAASFPDASYAQLTDAAHDLLGVYKLDEGHLYLLGVVSRTNPAFTTTNLAYNPPIEVLRFPLTSTSGWTSTSTVSGTASGYSFYATETWIMKVDDTGKTKTPAATFDTLRLRVDYKQVWFTTTQQVIYLWVAECYGTVARIKSQTGTTSADFTQASEYRRMTSP